MTTRNRYWLIFFIIMGAVIALVFLFSKMVINPSGFNGDRAYKDVIAQVALGPRVPGSPAHAQVVTYIFTNLAEAGWQVTYQDTIWEGVSILNIIAFQKNNNGNPPIILGAHYDSRILADQEQGENHNNGVPGANDGASGVAVLLELARTLPMNTIPVWLVFFDAEDNYGIGDFDGLMGSRAFVANLTSPPEAVVIVDMVGDSDLSIYIEANSDPGLTQEIWAQADKLGYEQFIPEIKYSIIDDHIPFLAAGIPAVDIIDFDYPYWHTLADTEDKVSPESLEAVGDTLLHWIIEK